jgi:FAD/FMN-containing dehydrogenase
MMVVLSEASGGIRTSMSKIAQYLNEHLLGTVTGLSSRRAAYATDESVLEVTPELVVYPKTTNDIRKAARFSWQLAEKGHVLSVTPRGFGGDITGGAIGSGLLIDVAAHLNSVLYVSSAKDKEKIVHVQPGASLRMLNEVLRWQGATIGAYSSDMPDMTVGGAIASGAVTYRSGKYGTVADAIDRMEVILANGDLMEVGRVSKREVSKKQGLQTLEGEIYRQIDAILEEDAELIGSLSSAHDNLGYRIDKVKQKDGSFDLTPLFTSSQGTLGIISEVVLKTGFYSDEESAVVVACQSLDDARDVADVARQLSPSALLLFEGGLFADARARGKRFIFDGDEALEPAAVVYVSFDDFGDKARNRKLKRLTKIFAKRDVSIFASDDTRMEELTAIRDIETVISTPLRIDETRVAVCDGAYIPDTRLSEFMTEVTALAEKQHVTLPLSVDILSGIISAKTTLHLKKVSDKQKVFKLASEYAALVHRFDGSIAGGQAEGRLGAFAGYPQVDEAIIALNAKVRAAFDPFGTLNPGVKQKADIKVLARQLAQ